MLKHIVFSQQLCPFMPKETKKVFGNTKEDSNQKPLFPLSALGPTVEMMFTHWSPVTGQWSKRERSPFHTMDNTSKDIEV